MKAKDACDKFQHALSDFVLKLLHILLTQA